MKTRAELLKDLDEMLRKLGAQSVLMSDTVASRIGLNSTDLECLDLLYLAGGTTAGKLAAHTGLTTGAMTAVLDRLERAGFVRRHRDLADRRRVLVQAVPSGISRIKPFYEPVAAAMAKLNARYDNRELATVLDYMSRALELGARHVLWLQTQPPARRRRPAPPGREPGARNGRRVAAVSRSGEQARP